MPQKRKHPDNRARQAAYRARQDSARQAQLQKRGLPALPTLASLPGSARWRAAIGQCADLLEVICEEMNAYFDDRSEAWQEGDRGVAHQERVEALQELQSTLEDLLD
jgi:hypothetical protein